MRHCMLLLMAVWAVLWAPQPLCAQGSSTRELIETGVGILGRTIDRHEERKQARREARAAGAENGQPGGAKALGADLVASAIETRAEQGGKRTWGDRGLQVADVLLNSDKSLGGIIKEAIDVVLDEYREQFKREGREYTKELGGILAERACSNPKIASTLTSIQVLCWSVFGYLTLVTLYLVFTVHRLRRANKRLLAIVQEELAKHAQQTGQKP